MNDNVSEMITKKIDDIVKRKNIYYSGQVIRVNNFIVEARGLDNAFYFEKVYINNEKNIGYVDKIEPNRVFISLIKMEEKIVVGDSVITTGEILEMSFSEDSVGMIIDPFGVDRMTGKKLNNSFKIPVETEKIGIMERTAVKRPLETGIAAIDLMFPIGRGQRQLIIGDKKTGKTQICLDTIVNQKDKNVLCIYVSIGKNKKELKNLYAKLIQKGAHAYTIIVSAFNDDLPPLIKLTPYIAVSIANHYLKQGKDVLVCIDDLKKHADACREIALLSDKNTGRDAYPADIFYTHSRLLEKGCQHKNGGSITILPIVETKGADITDYISTNIISITDGQIVLSEKMFKKGQKPAINYGLSVSRLGSDVQNELIKKVGAKVRRELLSYLEKVDVYQLVNIESMSAELQNQLNRGAKILDALKQPKYSPVSASELKDKFAFIDENNDSVEKKKDVENDDNSKENGEIDTKVDEKNEIDNNASKAEDKQNKEEFTKIEPISKAVIEPIKVESIQTKEEPEIVEPIPKLMIESTKIEPTPTKIEVPETVEPIPKEVIDSIKEESIQTKEEPETVEPIPKLMIDSTKIEPTSTKVGETKKIEPISKMMGDHTKVEPIPKKHNKKYIQNHYLGKGQNKPVQNSNNSKEINRLKLNANIPKVENKPVQNSNITQNPFKPVSNLNLAKEPVKKINGAIEPIGIEEIVDDDKTPVIKDRG